MQTEPLRRSEVERLHSLIDYRILDTPREGEFDHYARLVAQLCGSESGMVTLIDRDRQWVKAAYGPLYRMASRCEAFNALTILQEGVVEVPDALLDPRFMTDPTVSSDPWIRSYAGVALRARNGLPLGTISVIDSHPQRLTGSQTKALEIAGSHVEAQLEIRLGMIQLLEERQLAKSQSEALKRVNQRQKDLAALLVHDLRSPLSSMSVNGRFLLGDELHLSEDQQSALQDIIDAGERLTEMVNNLLQISRSEDGQLMVRSTVPVELAEVARSAIAHFRAVATESKVRLDFDPGPTSGIVEGDKDLLFRVMTNLLDNANKYAPAGSTVQLNLSIEGDSAVMRVVDEGTGIPREQRDRIFDKYFQVEQEAPVRPGFGLGLSFCKLAVEAHHGSIEVEDLPKGCAFRITLPRIGTKRAVMSVTPADDRQVATEAQVTLLDERETTDKSLSEERSKTDRVLEKREALSEASADSAMLRARTTADRLLSVARAQEDRRLDQSSAPELTRSGIEQDRVQDDILLGDQRSEADRKLREERDELKRALADLLGREREETDNDLLRERVGQLEQLRSVEEVLQSLNLRVEAQAQTMADAVRARDVFLSMASHELRTPLSALQLQIQGLIREAGTSADLMPPAVLRRLAVTERHVRRLEMLMERLLDVSSQSTRELEVAPVDLNMLIREVADRMELLTRQASCEVILKLAPHTTGMWDRTRLDRVISNLLSNAVKFGSGKPVTVSLESDGSDVRLSVEDHGIGIDPKDHERIFQRFERAVSDWNYSGFGLGLWLVKQMVNGLGGDVSVVSQLGSGTTFTVKLPIQS